MLRTSLLAILILICSASPLLAQTGGFWRVDGKRIVDPAGNPTMIRGIGLGGWLMPEGYMIDYPGHGALHEMNARIESLIGVEDAAEFWEIYREHYVAEKDVAQLVDWGFDHIRLPFHYNLFMDLDGTFKESGFEMLDEFLGWCETYGIPVILDLHATPGAQSAGPIADSDGVARLWTEPDPYQDLTVALWEEFARRYKDDRRIIGYDLINEPVTPESIGDGAEALRRLYVRLTRAIRAIDTNHILFIEGNYWATTFDKLTPPFDNNMVYAFHKYWNTPDTGTIWYLLSMRDEFNTPLWLGETGENSNVWYAANVALMAEHGIPWNWWTHKQIQATAAPLSSPILPGYRAVLDYWAGSGPRPSAEDARDALFDQARMLHIDSTDVRPDVLAALFNPSFASMREPYTDHRIPGTVNAVHYDIGNQGVTYSDEDYWAIEGSPGGGNSGGRYRNDGVDIEASTDPAGYDFSVGWIEPGEWMEYLVRVATAGTYDIEFRVASQGGGGQFSLVIDDVPTFDVDVPGTGGWQNWTSVYLRDVQMRSGTQIIRFAAGSRTGFNFNRMNFDLVEASGFEDAFELTGLFPQPASDRLEIEVLAQQGAAVTMRLYDVLGREVARFDQTVEPGVQDFALALDDLAGGLYLLDVRFDDGSGEHRIQESVVVVR